MHSSVISGPANCFTVGRFGPAAEGVAMRLVRKGERYTPNIQVGEKWIERAHVGGCHFKKAADGATGTVYRAAALPLSQGEHPAYTLGDVRTEVSDRVLVRVSVRNPNMKSLFMHDRELRLATGTMGGRMIMADGMEKFVEVPNGENLVVFFEDGWVRAFSVENSVLAEVSLTNAEMVDLRIKDMLSQLQNEKERWGGPREQVVRALIAKMLDLFRLTARYKEREGRDLRMMLVTEFFLKVNSGNIKIF